MEEGDYVLGFVLCEGVGALVGLVEAWGVGRARERGEGSNIGGGDASDGWSYEAEHLGCEPHVWGWMGGRGW